VGDHRFHPGDLAVLARLDPCVDHVRVRVRGGGDLGERGAAGGVVEAAGEIDRQRGGEDTAGDVAGLVVLAVGGAGRERQEGGVSGGLGLDVSVGEAAQHVAAAFGAGAGGEG